MCFLGLGVYHLPRNKLVRGHCCCASNEAQQERHDPRFHHVGLSAAVNIAPDQHTPHEVARDQLLFSNCSFVWNTRENATQKCNQIWNRMRR